MLDQVTKSDRRLALTTIPNGLFDTYKVTLERIRQQSESRSRLALLALTWVYLAERQLHVDELRHALAVKPGHTTFDWDGIPSKKVLLECCLGLVVIEAETSTIRLTHFTLQQYLDETGAVLFPLGHSVIAATCLTYLNFDHQGKSLQGMGDAPLLTNYVAYNIGHHLRKGSDSALNQQTLAIFHENKKFQILKKAMGTTFSSWTVLETTPLHWTCYFGVNSIGKLLLASTNIDAINAEDSPYGRTALSYAAEGGHDAIARQLLDIPGININAVDNNSCTPMHYAAAYGQEEMVRILLGVEGINVNSADDEEQTPLSLAAENGHEAIVRILLTKEGINVDSRCQYGRTPLSYAAGGGHKETVCILANTEGVSIDSKDNQNRTPLSWAAGAGHHSTGPLNDAASIVQLLMDQPNVDPDSEDNQGCTPLLYAANIGNTAVVRLLLKRNVRINHEDATGRTALSYAKRFRLIYWGSDVQERYQEVSQLLLDCGASDTQTSI